MLSILLPKVIVPLIAAILSIVKAVTKSFGNIILSEADTTLLWEMFCDPSSVVTQRFHL